MSSLKHPEIQLDSQEAAILDLIDGFTRHLKTTRRDLPHIECRVAGGWVRDKLLGLDSDDLDICISTLTGHHFATLLETYLQELRDAAPPPSSIDASTDMVDSHATTDLLTQTTKIAKIQANPDQSKHLETARMTVGGLDIDLVQLRSEEYAEVGANGTASRIPTSVKFGTPLEDALRRDITINALFYNVHSRQVEDFTEKGLTDLLSTSPLIRTPLEPLQTFLDDPLRILRCIRFASRLNFPLHDDIRPAVQDERVRHAFLTKVSKERIGTEFDKMLKGRDPLHALRLIHHLSLYDLLFSPISPLPSLSSPLPESASAEALLAGEILEELSKRLRGQAGKEKLLLPLGDKLAAKRLWLAICSSPLRGITFVEKAKTLPLSDAIIKDSIKLPNAERIFVSHIFSAHNKLSPPSLSRLSTDPARERSSLGLLLRDTDVHDPNNGLDWRNSVLFSLVMDVQSIWGDENAVEEVVETYVRFVQRIEELDLHERAFEKPRLDGKEISAYLGQPPGKFGKLLAVLINRVVEWQLDNPEGTKEECGSYIKAEYEAGNVTLPAEVVVDSSAGKGKGGAKPPKKKRKESV